MLTIAIALMALTHQPLPEIVTLHRVTTYQATPEQGWGDGTITADGSKITGASCYIAVSRDLLSLLAFGDSVTIVNSRLKGKYRIADTMNKRYRRSMDVLIHDIRQGGRWRGVLINRKY